MNFFTSIEIFLASTMITSNTVSHDEEHYAYDTHSPFDLSDNQFSHSKNRSKAF